MHPAIYGAQLFIARSSAGPPQGADGDLCGRDPAHSESVLLSALYDLHLEAGTGPMVKPFPVAKPARRPGECRHNPAELHRD
jgi:hypothetical protein